MLELKEREKIANILDTIHSDVKTVTAAVRMLLEKNNALEERVAELEMLLKEN